MEDKDISLIERYFRNELTSAERKAFERRLAQDEAFRQEAELHGKAQQAIRLKEKGEVLSRLSERGRLLDAQKNTAGRYRPWWLGGGFILLLAAFFWLQWNGAPSPETQAPPAVSPQEGTQQAVPPDTAQVIQPAETPQEKEKERQPPVASATEKQELLFAQYFQPYKDETLEPSVRGDEEPSASDTFQQLYWEGKYREALAQFESLPPAAKSNDNWLFIKAECLLVTGKAAAAATLLEAILAKDRTRFMPEASWHLALAWLKSGSLEKAKGQLAAVAGDAGSPWQANAAAVLKDLQ
ncbi:MAG: hypothetical protein H6557_25870 [Lewinellaceae bacterium]|nr:hypothetical protein [Phaeodactylibacter sp.]MCB9040064.1 hypothetical protein [Lewinellaceae bacterium]